MEKLYDRIEWHNNTTPAINETNLNLMSKAVDDIDDRVIDIAADVLVTVPQIQEDLEEAQELLEDAQEISTHPPIIGQNGNWWTWDTSIDAYADSGVDAGVSLTIGTTSTLTPGSDATVTNSGTATDPILNFGIPAGVAGQDGADGADGVSPTVTIGTITGGHSVTITDADHPTGQSLNVMDGEDGVGIPSGGTTGQVLTKSSNTNYDTKWETVTTPSVISSYKASPTTTEVYDAAYINGLATNLISDAWVTSHAYKVGDYCIDGNTLYKCKTAHTSSASYRPPYASYWDAVTVASELSGGGVNNNFIPSFSIQCTKTTTNTFTFTLPNGIGGYFLMWVSQLNSPNMCLSDRTCFYFVGVDEGIAFIPIREASNSSYRLSSLSYNSSTRLVTVKITGNPGSCFVGGTALYGPLL